MATRHLLPACGFVAVLFWLALAWNHYMRRAAIDVLLTTERPFVVNGFLFRLDESLSPAFVRGSHHSRYLVLVTADTCRYSIAEVERWKASVSQIPFRSEDRVLLISTDGTRVPHAIGLELDKRNVHFQIMLVSDLTQFMQENGISTTPRILALDSDMRVRVTATQLSGMALEEMARFFSAADILDVIPSALAISGGE